MIFFKFNFLALVYSFRDIRGPKFTLEGPALPLTLPSGKILTHPKYLPIHIAVKFQLRSSINVRLTESSFYYRFCIKRSPKMGFLGHFGGRDEDIWWKSTSVLRIARF